MLRLGSRLGLVLHFVLGWRQGLGLRLWLEVYLSVGIE